jgi:choloylglycine hydrolase
VDEALALFGQYNIDWGGGPPVHYLIADATGASAVVEMLGGEMAVTRSQDPWQISTNFLFAETPLERRGQTCWRYSAVQQALSQAGGALTEQEAMALLEQVSQPGETATIWSVVYNLSDGTVLASVGRDFQDLYAFTLSAQE